MPNLLNASRRRRIAKGSGTTVEDVNQLVKQFREMQKMMKQMGMLGQTGKQKKRRRRHLQGQQQPASLFNGGKLMDIFGRQ